MSSAALKGRGVYKEFGMGAVWALVHTKKDTSDLQEGECTILEEDDVRGDVSRDTLVVMSLLMFSLRIEAAFLSKIR